MLLHCTRVFPRARSMQTSLIWSGKCSTVRWRDSYARRGTTNEYYCEESSDLVLPAALASYSRATQPKELNYRYPVVFAFVPGELPLFRGRKFRGLVTDLFCLRRPSFRSAYATRGLRGNFIYLFIKPLHSTEATDPAFIAKHFNERIRGNYVW